MSDTSGTDSEFAVIESALMTTLQRVRDTFHEGAPKWRLRRDQVRRSVRQARADRVSEVITADSKVGLFAQTLVDELRRADAVLSKEEAATLERLIGRELQNDG